MDRQQMEENLKEISQIFYEGQKLLQTLKEGIEQEGTSREILDKLLQQLWLESNWESRYAAYMRIADLKFEPLDIALKQAGKSQADRDRAFEISYEYTRSLAQKRQEAFLSEIQQRKLLPEFYQCFLESWHILWVAHAPLFLSWNKALLFETNRQLEAEFGSDEAVLEFLKTQKLFDTGREGKRAERSYSILQKKSWKWKSTSYAELFPQEVWEILRILRKTIQDLSPLEDEVYGKKDAYLQYLRSLRDAFAETDTSKLLERWTQVDRAWMEIDTPIQPGHMMEYYEDQYRQAVSIECDLRIDDPALFISSAQEDAQAMYESMYEEIGRENFPKSYEYSLGNLQKAQLHIGNPVLQYGSFLCGAYSAQVVPNDDSVSYELGKKIFAFPKYVLQAQKSALRMQLETEFFSEDFLQDYRLFLQDEDRYYRVYDVETIGHEFGHTLWLTPGGEVQMWASGQFKNIEEFKATAGGLVSYFMSKSGDIDEVLLIPHIKRSIKMLQYREVEDVVPYYCECLIHLHILFKSGVIHEKWGKIHYKKGEKYFQNVKELYTQIYTSEIFQYLNLSDAGIFLNEYMVKENGVYLPKDKNLRHFVTEYYNRYLEIGNKLA